MQKGTLKGVLWHQGESDCKAELSVVYKEKLHRLIEQKRRQKRIQQQVRINIHPLLRTPHQRIIRPILNLRYGDSADQDAKQEDPDSVRKLKPVNSRQDECEQASHHYCKECEDQRQRWLTHCIASRHGSLYKARHLAREATCQSKVNFLQRIILDIRELA